MGTSAKLIAKVGFGDTRSIVLFSGGDPYNVLHELNGYYYTNDKIKKLFDEGDLSYLGLHGENVEPIKDDTCWQEVDDFTTLYGDTDYFYMFIPLRDTKEGVEGIWQQIVPNR